jgi:hypothetical protein
MTSTTSSWIDYVSGGAQLVAGGVIGVLLSQGYENYQFFKNRALGLRGNWLGEWQPVELGDEDRWEAAEIQLNYGLGWISLMARPSGSGMAWVAHLKSAPNRGLSGRWKSIASSSDNEGSIALVVSADGNYLFGAMVGVNSSGQRRIQNIVLGRDPDALRKAKEMLLSSDLYVDENRLAPLRRAYYQYNSTTIAGAKVWIASCIDFSVEKRAGYLVAYAPLVPRSGSEHIFEFKGILRGETLVLFVTGAEFKTTPNVWIYPKFSQRYINIIPGILSHYTWDMTSRYSQCLISQQPIVESTKLGVVTEAEARLLDAEWLKATNIISPFNFSIR